MPFLAAGGAAAATTGTAAAAGTTAAAAGGISASTAITAATTAASIAASVESSRRAGIASGLAARRASGQAQAERRNIVRQQRIRRAQVLNQSALQGTQGSSSEAGAVSGILTQTSQNLAQSFGTESLSRGIASNQQRAQDFSSASNIFGSGSQVASQFIKPGA